MKNNTRNLVSALILFQFACVLRAQAAKNDWAEGTPGHTDGATREYYNRGGLAFEKTDIRFRVVDKLKIEQIWMNVYHGGTRPSPYDQHVFIDNVVIAKKYIGPMTDKE